MSELADIEKNVALASLAIAFPIIVLPVPGGPNNSRPYGYSIINTFPGYVIPLKSSGFIRGHRATSSIRLRTWSNPAISDQSVYNESDCSISDSILSTNYQLTFHFYIH